jgi:hypothetical protein
MSDELRPGAYEGHALCAEHIYTCGGEPLVEVECWFVLPDEPGPDEPREADRA